HLVLRLGVAGEFVGHGLVGTGRPAAWLPFFQFFGFSTEFANTVMPLLGVWDIGLGLLILARPFRAALVWAALWGLFTALLRPTTGQGWWEFFERAANCGVPFALLLLSTGRQSLLARTLKCTVALLLIGHG